MKTLVLVFVALLHTCFFSEVLFLAIDGMIWYDDTNEMFQLDRLGIRSVIFLLVCCVPESLATFCLIVCVAFMYKPLSIAVYQVSKNLIAVRFFRAIFIILALINLMALVYSVCVLVHFCNFSDFPNVDKLRLLYSYPSSPFALSLGGHFYPLYGYFTCLFTLLCSSPIFLILWGISYIVFGSGDPFFVFKYDPYKFYNQESLYDTE